MANVLIIINIILRKKSLYFVKDLSLSPLRKVEG
jgi:hypothetical protein